MLSDVLKSFVRQRCGLTFLAGLLTAALTSCAPNMDEGQHMVVSVKEQKMLLVQDGVPVKTYPISTSKFGLGNERGSMRTPVGTHRIARKIGRGAPAGAVFKSRRYTGEVLRPNAPGRDPIVSRILWLDGQESGNRNSFDRYIYIHGTPEERNLGKPSSYGCIRMASRDVIDLYKRVKIGAQVHVVRSGLPSLQPLASRQPAVSEEKALAGRATGSVPSQSRRNGEPSKEGSSTFQLTGRGGSGRRPGA